MSSQLEAQLDKAVASGNLNWIAYVTKRMAEVQAQAQAPAPAQAPHREPLDLESARREDALRQRHVPKPPQTEVRLILVRPENEPPKEDRAPKYTTERPYLEKNRRFKRWGTL